MHILSLLFAVCYIVLNISDAYAVKVNSSASIEIVEPLGFTESSGFGTFYIERSESIFKRVLGVSSTNEDYVEAIEPSEYFISGSETDSIQIQVISSAGDGDGVRVGDFVLSYSKDSKNSVIQQAPGKNASLKLGATLTVAGGVKSGVYEPAFEIAIYYE